MGLFDGFVVQDDPSSGPDREILFQWAPQQGLNPGRGVSKRRNIDKVTVNDIKNLFHV